MIVNSDDNKDEPAQLPKEPEPEMFFETFSLKKPHKDTSKENKN